MQKLIISAVLIVTISNIPWHPGTLQAGILFIFWALPCRPFLHNVSKHPRMPCPSVPGYSNIYSPISIINWKFQRHIWVSWELVIQHPVASTVCGSPYLIDVLNSLYKSHFYCIVLYCVRFLGINWLIIIFPSQDFHSSYHTAPYRHCSQVQI